MALLTYVYAAHPDSNEQNSQGLVCASRPTVRYGVPTDTYFGGGSAVLFVTMAVGLRSAAYRPTVDFVKMLKSTKLLLTRCVSQAQNASKLVFGRGSAQDPAGGA